MGLHIFLHDKTADEYIDLGKQVGDHGYQMPAERIAAFLRQGRDLHTFQLTHDALADFPEDKEVDSWFNHLPPPQPGFASYRFHDGPDKFWCKTHRRIATHIMTPVGGEECRCCNPRLSGILARCEVEKLTTA